VSRVEQELPTLSERTFFYGFRFVVHVVKLYVFMFLVPCCDVHYDLRVKTKFDSSRLPFVM